MKKFIIISKYGEILDIAINIPGSVFYVQNHDYHSIGKGMVDKDDWYRYLGLDYTWIIDDCDNGEFSDWLRSRGEKVFGSNKIGNDLEENRQASQKLFESFGFKQPMSENFTDIDKMLEFIKANSGKRLILKQNGTAPKSVNHMSKFDGCDDLIQHIEELKEKWNKNEYGDFNCDIMEVVDGVEVACTVFFNGQDFARNEKGKIIGFLNFEEKKECDGGLGATVGEMGTTFFGCTEGNKIFDKIIIPDKLGQFLKDIKFIGCFDINGCINKDGSFTGFEPTPRFGIPTASYLFSEGIEDIESFFYNMARGISQPVKIKEGWGMCTVVVAKPFPVDGDVEHIDEIGTSLNEKLWIMDNKGKIAKDFSEDQKKHIHLCNFKKEDNGDYKVATKMGWMLVVSITGSGIKDCRDKTLDYIKKNIFLSGMKYRQDIGKRIEDKMNKL